MFSEILPYLEVAQGNQDEVKTVEQIQVPNVQGLSIKDAEKVVKELGLDLNIENDSEDIDKENTVVTEQTPKEGITVNKGSKVYIKY